MTKQEFIARCEAQWDSTHTPDDESLLLLSLSVDYVMRKQWWQDDIAQSIWERIQELSGGKILATNFSLYNALDLASRLAHPCQKCAENKDAWATRWAWCEHNNNL